VIGGDSDGNCQGKSPVSNVYFAEIDNDKEDNSLISEEGWRKSNNLPFATSFTQAVLIDTFIYVVGGFDGTSARNTLLRAQVLQPSDAPHIEGVMHASVDGKLPVGHYLYAVTAVYKAGDSINPNGQSLPSNIVSLYVPQETAVPYLSWTKIDDGSIDSYRVFRANADDGKFSVIAEVTESSFADDGSKTPSDGEPPALGSLGNWATISNSMSVARCGHVTTSFNPSGTNTLHYMFSFGGSTNPSPKSRAFDSYESAKITVTPAVPGGVRQNHVVNAWTNGTTVMNGQHLWSGVMLDKSNVGYDQFQAVVLGPGAENTTEHQFNYAQNNDMLDVDPFTQKIYNDLQVFGYCMFAHDKTLVVTAGSNDVDTVKPLKAIHVMELDDQTPPDPLTNYTSGNMDIVFATVYPACVRAAGYLVVIGGRSNDGIEKRIQFIPG